MNVLRSQEDLIQFQSFTDEFPDWKKTFDVYDRDSDDVYQRIKCVWEDRDISHEYHAIINTKTGDIYLDCQRRKIFAKHFTFIFLRPIYTIIKTIWHTTIVGPAALEIYKTATGKQTVLKGLKNYGWSILDIGITPLTGLAMTVISIASVILSPFNPNLLYRGRELIGSIERFQHHTDNLLKATTPSLSPCFSPFANIATIHSQWRKVHSRDTESVKVGLVILAKILIKFRMNNRALFNNCMRLHPEDKQYVSAAAS